MSDASYNGKELPRRIHSGWWREGHVQGIAVDLAGGAVYWSFTTVLLKTDLAGTPIGSVKGIVGHLGCITLDAARRRVYGSLELKHDAIGAGIVARTGKTLAEEDAFYLVSFDMDRIDRMDMDAEADGVMTAVYLPDVVEDYAATDEVSGALHRYGCSGIDGIALGPVPLDRDRMRHPPEKLYIAYGIYSDTTRTDNDHQVILELDPSVIWWKEEPLSQAAPHHSGRTAERKLFFHTGNTTYGIQNLEYDPYTRTYMAAVYPGAKEQFVNHPFFFIDGTWYPVEAPLAGRGMERGLTLTPARPAPSFPRPVCDARGGCGFPLGSTGMAALGGGLYYFSRHLDRPGASGGREFASELWLYRLGETADAVFVPLD